jgi:hypothetical protein
MRGIPITLRVFTEPNDLGNTFQIDKIFPIHDPVPTGPSADGIPTLLIKGYRCKNNPKNKVFAIDFSDTDSSLQICNKLVINSSDCGSVGKKQFYYSSLSSVCTCC